MPSTKARIRYNRRKRRGGGVFWGVRKGKPNKKAKHKCRSGRTGSAHGKKSRAHYVCHHSKFARTAMPQAALMRIEKHKPC